MNITESMNVEENEIVIKEEKITAFQESWLNDNIFKDWLIPHSIPTQAFCTVCKVTVPRCKIKLVEHLQSSTHLKETTCTNVVETTRDKNENAYPLTHLNKVKALEIRISAFFVQHNIPFHAMERFVPMIKEICQDPRVIVSLLLNQSVDKDENNTENTENINKPKVGEMIANLQTCNFSILLDEGIVNNNKVVSVFVQYFSPQDKKITAQLLKFICLQPTDPIDKCCKEFKKLFEQEEIPLENIVAVSADAASTMPGCNAIKAYLESKIPGLITLNCIGYTATFIFNEACGQLPLSCQTLICDAVSYISENTEEFTYLDGFQDIFNAETSKILKSSDSWLVLHKCIVKLTENWDLFKKYFANEVEISGVKSAQVILKQLNDDSMKAYLLFLKYILQYFNHLIALYQSKQFLIHTLYENSQQLICEVAQHFVTPNALKDVVKIDLNDPNTTLSVDDINVGPECESFLDKLSSNCAFEIRSNCFDFYITVFYKMLECLPCKDTTLKELMFLQPNIALYFESRRQFKDLTAIATLLRQPDITKLAYEWRILPSIYDDTEKQELARLEISVMWQEILKSKDFDGEKMFPNLELLVKSVLSFPHSNAKAKENLSIIASINDETDDEMNNT